MLLGVIVAAAIAAQEPAPAVEYARKASLAFEKAREDATLDRAQRLAVITAGVADADRALAIDAKDRTCLVYKNLLLRYQAALTDDERQQDALIRQAEQVRAAAIATLPAAPPTDYEASSPEEFEKAVARGDALRAGAGVQPTRKVIDVRPVLTGVSGTGGTVLLDVLIGTTGTVGYISVRRAPEGMSDAARTAVLNAVSKWQYLPLLHANKLRSFVVPVSVTIDVR